MKSNQMNRTEPNQGEGKCEIVDQFGIESSAKRCDAIHRLAYRAGVVWAETETTIYIR
jgi:hypothetical protein